jgi:hypothetical protein
LSLSKTRGVTAENLAARAGPASSKKLGSVTLSSGVRRRRVRVGLPRRGRACPYPATCGGALRGSRWRANGDGGPMAAGRARLAPRPPPPPPPTFPLLPHPRTLHARPVARVRPTPPHASASSAPVLAGGRHVASRLGGLACWGGAGRSVGWPVRPLGRSTGGERLMVGRVLRIAAGVDHGIGIQLTDGLHNKIEG